MSFRFKAALCGLLAALSSGYSYAALDEVAQAVSQGDYGTALHALRAAPEQQRQSIEGQLLKAAALAGNGQPEQAEAQYRALIEQAPTLPEAYNNLAALYAQQGKLEEARKLLEQAMHTNPRYATVYDNLNSIYLAMSRSSYAKALQMGQNPQGPSLKPLNSIDVPQPAAATPVVVASATPPVSAPVTEQNTEQAPAIAPDAAGTVSEDSNGAVSQNAPPDTAVTEQADNVTLPSPPPLAQATDGQATPQAEGQTDGRTDGAAAAADKTDTPDATASAQEGGEQQAGTASSDDSQAGGKDAPEDISTPPVVVASDAMAQKAARKTEKTPPASNTTEATASAAKTPVGSSSPADRKKQRKAVIDMLKSWAKAWAGQDVEGYLNAYASTFQPNNGLSPAQWRAQRHKRLNRPAFIQVQVGDFEVKLQGDNRAIADLVQYYHSDTYRDLTRKRFHLIHQPDGWKITSEKTVEVLK